MDKSFRLTIKTYLFGALMLVVFSCSKDNEGDQLNTNLKVDAAEVKTVLQTDDYTSAVDAVLTEAFMNGQTGKSTQKTDCYVADFSETGYTLTFNGCSIEEGGEVLNGTIVVTYKIGAESSAFTASYTDLAVGQITVNGTRSFTVTNNPNQQNVAFSIISDMNVELADGTTISESGEKDFMVVFDETNIFNSALTLTGNWTVIANGNTYVLTTTSPLKLTFNCEYIGQGSLDLNKNGLAVSFDFGDGTCDAIALMTYPNGVTQEVDLTD